MRTCTLEKGSFDVIETWLGEQRRVWEDRTDRHEQLGFHDGWGTVTRQLADLVESRA